MWLRCVTGRWLLATAVLCEVIGQPEIVQGKAAQRATNRFQDIRPRRRSPFWSGALGLLISRASSTQRQFAAKRLFISRRPNWSSSAAATAVNNCGVLNCQNHIHQWKQAKAAERREKRRFVCRRVVIRVGIHEGHQAFRHLWRWLRAWSCQAADTAGQAFQTARLLSPSLLNHHHSGHLPDRWRDLSPVRCVPPVADSPSEAGGVPPPLFPVIKPSPPRRMAPAASLLRAPCLHSLLSRSCDHLNSCSFQWERSSLLDRTALWFSRLSEGPAKAELSNTGAGWSDLHSRKKPTPGPDCCCCCCFTSNRLIHAELAALTSTVRQNAENLTLNCSFLLVVVSSVQCN